MDRATMYGLLMIVALVVLDQGWKMGMVSASTTGLLMLQLLVVVVVVGLGSLYYLRDILKAVQ